MKELHNFITGLQNSLYFGCSTDKTLNILCCEAIVRFLLTSLGILNMYSKACQALELGSLSTNSAYV